MWTFYSVYNFLLCLSVERVYILDIIPQTEDKYNQLNQFEEYIEIDTSVYLHRPS